MRILLSTRSDACGSTGGKDKPNVVHIQLRAGRVNDFAAKTLTGEIRVYLLFLAIVMTDDAY